MDHSHSESRVCSSGPFESSRHSRPLLLPTTTTSCASRNHTRKQIRPTIQGGAHHPNTAVRTPRVKKGWPAHLEARPTAAESPRQPWAIRRSSSSNPCPVALRITRRCTIYKCRHRIIETASPRDGLSGRAHAAADVCDTPLCNPQATAVLAVVRGVNAQLDMPTRGTRTHTRSRPRYSRNYSALRRCVDAQLHRTRDDARTPVFCSLRSTPRSAEC